MENSKRVFEKILLEKNTLWSDGYFAFLSATLTKKQPKIIYGTNVEVDAYIHWAESDFTLWPIKKPLMIGNSPLVNDQKQSKY